MFEEGDIVKLHGLKSQPQWNGKSATISGAFNWNKGRYPVRVEIKKNNKFNEALLKPSNLKFIRKAQIYAPSSSLPHHSYEVCGTQYKGCGIMAGENIPAGTIIFYDTPLIGIPRGIYDDELKAKSILDQFSKLMPNTQQVLLTYHSQIDSQTNSIVVDDDDSKMRTPDTKELLRDVQEKLKPKPNLKVDETTKAIGRDLETVANGNTAKSKMESNAKSEDSTTSKVETSSDALSESERSKMLGIYFTNSFTITNDESSLQSGFFPRIARLNHNCFPNCEVLKFDPITNSRAVVALFDIQKGLELTIDYIGNTYHTLSMPYKERRQYLLDNYNFDCRCYECYPYHCLREGHRAEFGKCQLIIDEEVQHFNKKAFKTVLAQSRKMINILQEGFAGFPTVMGQCYVNAAHALLYLNQYREAMEYLKKTIEIDRTFYGKRAILVDVEECLAKIPAKLRKEYPWKHVLDLR